MKKTEEKTKQELYYLGILDRASEATAEQGITGQERCVAELKKLVHAQFSSGLVRSRLGIGLVELKAHPIPAIQKAAGDALEAMEYSLYQDFRLRNSAVPLKVTKRLDFKKPNHRPLLPKRSLHDLSKQILRETDLATFTHCKRQKPRMGEQAKVLTTGICF